MVPLARQLGWQLRGQLGWQLRGQLARQLRGQLARQLGWQLRGQLARQMSWKPHLIKLYELKQINSNGIQLIKNLTRWTMARVVFIEVSIWS